MPSIYEYLNDPGVLSYFALKDNPALADQYKRNDERNYALLNAAQIAANAPKMARFDARGNPQLEWMNSQMNNIEQWVASGNPDMVKQAFSAYQELLKNAAQSMQLTAEQRNNAWNNYNVPVNQMDPYVKGQIDQQNKIAELDRRLKNDQEMARTNWGYRQAELKMQNENPKPLTEYQQFQVQEKEQKRQMDLNDAVSNIDDTIGDFERLKAIQEVTSTGPIVGSAPVAAIRKMLPNSISGGENLQRLEKGYNTLAVKAIGAFRAGGVTFGQLSNKEGEWIRSTQQTIDTGGEINQEMLNEGLRLLQERKNRLLNRGARTGATGSWEAQSQPAKKMTAAEWRAANPGGTKEQWLQYYSSK